MERILVIDNYDSFTYNLVYYIEQLAGNVVDVYRNDEISLREVDRYSRILLSPGPGIPIEAGICLDLIKEYAHAKNIIGICLGHQAIAEAFGGKLLNLSHVHHGVSSKVTILQEDEPLFSGLPESIEAGRYHSWVVSKEDIPADFDITCEDAEGTVMGIRHKKFNLHGLQFHPESVLTEHGMDIMRNWINL